MAIIPDEFAQATVNFAGQNLPNGGAIVIGVKPDVGLTPLQAATAVFNAFAGQVDNMCTSDVSIVGCDIKYGPNDTGPIANYVGTPVAGAVGATSLSPGSAILVEKQSGFGGRRGRGRMYWPGVYDGWVDDNGALGSGIQAQVNGFMVQLLANLAATDVPMYLLHSPSYTWAIVGGQPRRVYGDPGDAPDPYIVTALSCDPVIATQRRRLR